MCGIAGFVGSIFSQKQLKENISHACKALRHRGPDQDGFFVDEGLALGVTRLAIRDSKNGMQPMTRQGMSLIFNGELYETKSLKEKLLALGYSFKTDCDTEVLLNALIEFGIAIIKELVGMFAFALWDSKSKKLYFCRDRWGEKPLYYTMGKGFLAFASEIKALKTWPNLKWEISLEDIRVFLKNSYLPNPRTGFENVFKLPQGSILSWQEGKLSICNYFSPLLEYKKFRELPRTVPLPEKLFHLLSSSVKNCLVSDRPVGAFLSGGIDSTTIASLLSQYRQDSPVFSLLWDDKTYSEEFYSVKAARMLGLKHYTVKCTPSFFLNHFETIVDLYDEPFADESMIPTYCLASFAKQFVDVVLTGDGADEFFHGYERYFFQGSFENYLEAFAPASNKMLQVICHPHFIGDGKYHEPFLQYYFQAQSHIKEDRLRSWVDIQTYLTDDILMKVDRACMGVSLEARAPFLAPQVTNFAMSCSQKELVSKTNRGKEILRRAMGHLLPEFVLNRKKMGFGVPLHHWFQSSLKEWMEERILDGKLLDNGWFSKKGLTSLVASPINSSRVIFNLLVLERWLRKN